MKKFLICTALLLIMLLLFTSCASPLKITDTRAVSSSSPTSSRSPTENEQSSPAPSQSPTEDGQSSPAPSQSADTAKASPEPVDSGLTLEGIKQAAQAANYVVEDHQDLQTGLKPDPVDGFYMNYKDENSETTIPIFEFASAADAQAYAKQVNESDYNLCIVNGKFLTMTGASYGIVTNDNEAAVLEGLLQSKVMEYTAPAPASNYTNDFAGGSLKVYDITMALNRLVNRTALLYNKTLADDDPNSLAYVSFALLFSGDLSFVGTLSEDQADLDTVMQVWETFGCTDVKLKHDAPNDYVLTGKRAGVDSSFEIHCSYSPENGSLRLVDKDGGETAEIYEFVPLGGDKYAFQNKTERCIIEYKDGKIGSFVYSMKTNFDVSYEVTDDSAETTRASAYGESDSIYPDGNGADEAWVSKDGEDSYDLFVSFDGSKLDIAANTFFGNRVKVALTVQ